MRIKQVEHEADAEEKSDHPNDLAKSLGTDEDTQSEETVPSFPTNNDTFRKKYLWLSLSIATGDNNFPRFIHLET